MDNPKPEIARLFAAKEKVRAVVRLQEMVAPVLRARGKKVRVWKIGDPVA
jgi:hypothetical protein